MLKLSTFSILLLNAVVFAQKHSPCPEVFSYEPRGTEEDRWYGVLSLRTSEDLTGIWIHILLDRPAELLGNWFGEATSTDNIEYIIKNPRYKLEAGPPVSVRFFVKYNTASIIPSVKTIRLNGKTICSANSSDVSVMESTTLHISRPSSSSEDKNDNIGVITRPNLGSSGSNSNKPNRRPVNRDPDNYGQSSSSNSNRPNSNSGSNKYPNNRPTDQGSSISLPSVDPNDEPAFPGDHAFQTQRPSVTRPPSQPSIGLSNNVNCGVISQRPNPLISYGQETAPGDWPWHTALYHSQGVQLVYTCGGTLISKQHVVTAAHCVTVQQTNRPLSPDRILVYLGKYNLAKFGQEVQDREVERIFVHPDYNHTLYFNDIAILKLERPAEITNFVRPCCLWDQGSTSLDNVINKQGVVVGWGFDENRKLSNVLMKASMPVVSTVNCIYSNREFFSQFTFEKNYCAGFRNGTSVCNGDSGGGMVFPKTTNSGETIWQLRGLVSVSIALQGQKVCDPSHYVVFTGDRKSVV